MGVGRPTDYSKELIAKAQEYLNKLPKDEALHSIEGLAEFIGVTRATIYDWEKQESKEEFSYIVEQVRQKQAKTLVNKGLQGKFQPSITKVMMTKHGYREGLDLTSKDEVIQDLSTYTNAELTRLAKEGDGGVSEKGISEKKS